MDTTLQSLVNHSAYIIYTALFILIFLENIIPFVPGDTVLIFSAYLSGRGITLPIPTFILSVLGSLLGFCFIFYLSRTWGKEFYQKLRFPIVSQQKKVKYKQQFQKYGSWSLTVGRIIPGSRLILALTAGLMKMPFVKAVTMTTIGVVIWNSIIFRSGMLLGEHWEIIKTILSQYSTIVNILFVLLLTIFIIIKFLIPIITKIRDHE